MKKTKQVNPEVSAAAAALGRKGGAKGTGESKRRNPEFYKVTLAEARGRARLKKQLAKYGEPS